MFIIYLYTDLPITLENLRRFVREQSKVYMILKGCLEQFDHLAGRFVEAIVATSAQSPDAHAILTEAEEQQAALSEEVSYFSFSLDIE